MLPLGERSAAAALVLGVPAAWLYEFLKYRRLLRGKDGRAVRLAPIIARGKVLEDLGPTGVASALRAELLSISQALQRLTGSRPAPYIAPALVRDSGYYLVGLRQEAPIPLEITELDVTEVKQEIVLRLGSVTIPISALQQTFVSLIAALPVPGRAGYINSLIRVSLVASGGEACLTVHSPATPAVIPEPESAADKERRRSTAALTRRLLRRRRQPPPRRDAAGSAILRRTGTANSLSDVNSLVRDAAFMILEIEGSFGPRGWLGMRSLVDGLVALDEYGRSGDAAARDRARDRFRTAAQADPANNLEALYFHGSMTMVEQTDDAIDEASRCFERALVTPHAQLRALLHSGLAYCRAQEFHRLGRFKPQVLDEALRHAETAGAEWTKYQDEQKQRDPRATVPLHPLIPYTLALVTTVNEGAVADHSERVARFTRACELYARAIALEPHNGLFHNNLGWVLLKLAQWGIDQGGLAGGAPTVLRSEEHLRRSLELNPRNRLTHANLCLLYSLPHFRDQTGSLYLSRCRYHGLKAVQLEKRYINGYRDLAVALVRYGELDEAYTHFVEALRLADSPEKDQEIIRDVVAEVEQRGESPPELERWRQPDPKLLHPRVSLTGVQRSATGG